MRCKISQLKTLLKEALQDTKYHIAYDKIWVPISSVGKRSDWDGETLLYLPSAKTIETDSKEMADYQERLAHYNTSPNFDFTAVSNIEATRRHMDQLNKRIAERGKICVVINGDFGIFNVRFVESNRVERAIMPPDLWIAVDVSSPDYRPDETLPEDYYAL